MINLEGNKFSIGGTTFQLIAGLTDMFTLKEADGLVIAKSRRYLEKYIALKASEQHLENVFELGIFRGGSTAFLSEFFAPRKLVAIDFKSKPAAALSAYIENTGKTNSVRPYYGVNQADTLTLERIVAAEFQNQPLDLVIDDASHMLEETRVSFNCLFPKLRAGGLYIIEDWAWAHTKSVTSAITDSNPLAGKASLANLIFEIQLASVVIPEVIDEVVVNDAFVLVRKGNKPTDSNFDVSACGLLMDNLTKGRIFI